MSQNMKTERTCHPRTFLLLLETILSRILILTIHVPVVSSLSPTQNFLV